MRGTEGRLNELLRQARIATGAAVLVLFGNHSGADQLTFEEVKLPALRLDGRVAKAHTQGLEVSGGSYYVTARREDVRPKRALLLRLRPAATNWEVWDITAVARPSLE